MKVIAFVLPQYHRIPENDEWWGTGYTEWTAVRNATPLFKGHYQPREPYADYYYDLLDHRVHEWQQNLARDHGIYGFCYYHYWFLGRLLLEKPFEHLLAHKDLTLPFCLSWANHSWSRTWYGRESDVLLAQEYGGREDWRKHFEYLLPAFLDERYITVDSKPVFVIHDSGDIKQCGDMLTYWSELARRHGLKGIHFVQTLGGFLPDPRPLPFDARLQFEPGYTMVNDSSLPGRRLRRYVGLVRYGLRRLGYTEKRIDTFFDYESVYDCIVKRPPDGGRVYLGVFTDWDNSPRRKYRSSVFLGASPEKFEEYLVRQIVRSRDLFKSNVVFINAWNEWGEGAYLEPDRRFGKKYLEAVRNALARTA